MSKLLPILALSASVGLAGCKDKPASRADHASAKRGSSARTAAPPGPRAEAELTPDVPAACTAYQAAIEKLAACESLPAETREILRRAYAQAAAGWASAPADSKAAIGTACAQAVEAIEQVAAACP